MIRQLGVERRDCHFWASLALAGAAPLLYAGITTYSPMRRWGVTEGTKVGVVGLGGLGHMGVKFADKFGARYPEHLERITGR